MADLAVTAAQVIGEPDLRNQTTKVAGVAINAGQVVYFDEATGLLRLADADPSGSGDPATQSKAAGIALCSCAANQPCTYQYAGEVTLGAAAAPVVGQTYCVSVTAGGIAPYADLTSGKYVTVLGVGKASNKIVLGINASGIAKA
jgi:hypothetical protein